MKYKKILLLAAFFNFNANAATDYSVADSNCIAWSQDVVNGDFSYSFAPAIPYGGGIQTSFMAFNIRGKSQEHIDTVIQSKVNGRTMSFAVQGHGDTIIFRPQEKSDTKFILDAATTGSLTFNGMVFKTGGTKTIINYMLAQCKE
ncbi:hypothetical protein ACEUAB_03345 [Aeromonas veronii]